MAKSYIAIAYSNLCDLKCANANHIYNTFIIIIMRNFWVESNGLIIHRDSLF